MLSTVAYVVDVAAFAVCVSSWKLSCRELLNVADVVDVASFVG